MARAARGGGGPEAAAAAAAEASNDCSPRSDASSDAGWRGGCATTVRWRPARRPFCVRLWRTCALARLIVRPRGAARSARALGHLLLGLPPTAPRERLRRRGEAPRRSARFRGGGGDDDVGIGPAIEAPSADVAADLAARRLAAASSLCSMQRRRRRAPPQRPPRDARSARAAVLGQGAPPSGRAAATVARRALVSAAAEGGGAAELEARSQQLPSWAAALRGWQMGGKLAAPPLQPARRPPRVGREGGREAGDPSALASYSRLARR